MGQVRNLTHDIITSIAIPLPLGDVLYIKARKSKKAKRLIIKVDARTSDVLLVYPCDVSFGYAKRFAKKHTHWILKQINRLPERVVFSNGAFFPIFGKFHKIKHCPDEYGNVWVIDGQNGSHPELLVTGGAEYISRRVTDWLKKMAKAQLTAKTHGYAKRIDRKIGKVSIRDPISRWGSCSSRGTLSFSWRLIFAPEIIMDYVCAHEVAHLVEMNHSAKFWYQVNELMSDWEFSKNWLRKNGNKLHRYG